MYKQYVLYKIYTNMRSFMYGIVCTYYVQGMIAHYHVIVHHKSARWKFPFSADAPVCMTMIQWYLGRV
mgnify:CR=1 FL=1